jgi:hypothetical protein
MDVHPAIDPNCGAGCEGKFTRSHCRDGAPDIFRAFGEIIFDEGEARARGSIGSHAFGDRRIDRSVANDNVEVSPGQCDHNALADPTHSARDSRAIAHLISHFPPLALIRTGTIWLGISPTYW